MKTIRKRYLAAFLLSVLGLYALVFGDAGYIKRKMMKKELLRLQSKVSLLQAENRYLSGEYASLSKRKTLTQKKTLKNSNLTILKFEEDHNSRSNFLKFFPHSKDRMLEARLLFLVIVFFLGSCGYLLLYHLGKKQEPRETINSDE